MKNKIKTCFWVICICLTGSFMSCQDMLETNSNSYLNTKDNHLNSPNDSLYSVVGILKQLQQLGDRYVVLGELRGDLMAVTGNADMDLLAIAGFTATADNPYLSTREYYSVINNCNYFIQHADTSIISGGKKVLKSEYLAVKAIRAWTYMQLVLNYGKAVYFTEPILTIDDMNRDYPVMPPQQLFETLLSDISDFTDDSLYPAYGGELYPAYFISGEMMAGDMLLWMGAYTGDRSYYEKAANIYYSYIKNNRYCRGGGIFRNTYLNSDFDAFQLLQWSRILLTSEEMISLINNSVIPLETLNWPQIMTLTYAQGTGFDYKVKPSQAAIDMWNNETYVHYNSITENLFYTKGDLRGNCRSGSSSTSRPYGSYYYAAEGDSLPTIAKYGWQINNDVTARPYISLYRTGKLYLRYAEALNGLGKPSLAFAVLKYGLNNESLGDPKKINPDEITPMPSYCNFTDSRFGSLGEQAQTGIHTRGSGYAGQDTLYYSFTEETLLVNSNYYGFPSTLATQQDSIQFVDAMICKELGLETAFEGNRFHDLMRFSIRRNDDGFLAKWVGRKDPALTGTLMNRDKWYFPKQ